MKTSRLAACPAAVATGLSAPCARFGPFVPPSILRGTSPDGADLGQRGDAAGCGGVSAPVLKESIVPLSSALTQGFARSARPFGRKHR
ncbi:hypothetical protein [Haloferula sp. BvORR071]|uniref:hypothetical protein n=1 Tax=Haloferula sp. BvORR071 TaxID=1396141 RepID=UPI0022410109|nr:hypothetical protein [Haloferula sp. BvORR071]